MQNNTETSITRCDESRPSEQLAELMDSCGHYFAHRVRGSSRGQSITMSWLAHNPASTQKELGEALGVASSSLSEVLMKLERKGLVAREKDERDHRLVRVSLTEEGERALDEPEPADDPFDVLSQSERDTLTALLSKLLHDWETHCGTERSRGGKHTHDGHSHGGHGSSGEQGCHCRSDEHPGHGSERTGHDREHSRRESAGRGDRFRF